MLIRKCSSAIVWLLLASPAAPGPAEDGPDKVRPPQIIETQLTLRLVPMQGRATVIAIADETLTILTAAHFLAPEDVGRTIQVQQEAPLRGRLVAVTRNPSFRQLRSRNSNAPSAFGTLGVDTAIATIKVNLGSENERRALAKIRTADLTRDPLPNSDRQALSVHIVDQFGVEHTTRAGNHLNPRCLAWGKQSYDTQRGDSGAGVFLIRPTPEGQPVPILIGSVAQTDERGGIASLASRNERWIEKAITGLPAESK